MEALREEFFGLIPSLTTAAGACLTAKNWCDSGINWISVDLVSLLIKPGYETLMRLTGLQEYCGWTKGLILDASTLPPPKNLLYKIRSPYDGSIIEPSQQEILDLICRLNPQWVLLSASLALEAKQMSSISSLIPAADFNNQPEYGVYISYEPGQDWKDFMNQIQNHSTPYIKGSFSPEQIADLAMFKLLGLQSDQPASDAAHGIVYSPTGNVDVQNQQFESDFRVIHAACKCPTCGQEFTRAYLHHLLAQTPLLCQRFLIQHNIHYCQTLFSTSL
jgi:queuine tRNA-ribosyltransferase